MRFHEFAVILEAPTEPSMLSKVGSWIGDKLGIHSAFTVTTPAASQGTDVADMQKALAALGYSRLLGAFGPKQDGVDGIVGEYTIRAVKRFQADNSIAPTGTTDAATIAALNKAIASKPAKSRFINGNAQVKDFFIFANSFTPILSLRKDRLKSSWRWLSLENKNFTAKVILVLRFSLKSMNFALNFVLNFVIFMLVMDP